MSHSFGSSARSSITFSDLGRISSTKTSRGGNSTDDDNEVNNIFNTLPKQPSQLRLDYKNQPNLSENINQIQHEIETGDEAPPRFTIRRSTPIITEPDDNNSVSDLSDYLSLSPVPRPDITISPIEHNLIVGNVRVLSKMATPPPTKDIEMKEVDNMLNNTIEMLTLDTQRLVWNDSDVVMDEVDDNTDISMDDVNNNTTSNLLENDIEMRCCSPLTTIQTPYQRWLEKFLSK